MLLDEAHHHFHTIAGRYRSFVSLLARDGGALLLVADHMPFAGAAETLALAFGAVSGNGCAADSTLDTAQFALNVMRWLTRAAPPPPRE